MKMMKLSDGSEFPRRSNLETMIKEELAIYNLVQEIERLGAHPLLTDTVVLLCNASEKLADWVDSPEYVETPNLLEAAKRLRVAQKNYMKDRGNNDLGKEVGKAGANLDVAIAAYEASAKREAEGK